MENGVKMDSTKNNVGNSSSSSLLKHDVDIHRHHVMILMHGITGNHKEMGYVKCSLEKRFQQEQQRQQQNSIGTRDSFSSLYVHSATCNEYQNSLDGIEKCGLRLANEINDVLHRVGKDKVIIDDNNRSNIVIALSIVGNSMGGLFARYALKYIHWVVQIDDTDDDNKHHNNSTKIPIVPNVFVTTATPHLGIKNFTYFKTNTLLTEYIAEPVFGFMMGQSGNDLMRRPFNDSTTNNIDNDDDDDDGEENIVDQHTINTAAARTKYNDIIEQMSFDPEFLNPLSKFKKRIAYANAYSTDICVTTETAAFLTDNEDDDENDDERDGDCKLTRSSSLSSLYFSLMNNFKSSNENESDDDDSLLKGRTNGNFSSSRRRRRRRLSSSHFFVNGFDLEEEEEGKAAEEEDRKETDENHNDHHYLKKSASANDISNDNNNDFLSIRFDTMVSTATNTATKNETAKARNRKSNKPASASEMAKSLDSLGWSKHFIDNRRHIPSIFCKDKKKKKQQTLLQRRRSESSMMLSLPSALTRSSLVLSSISSIVERRRDRRSKNFNVFYDSPTTNNRSWKKEKKKNEDDDDKNNNDTTKKSFCCYSSSDLKDRLCTDGWDGNTLPFAHSFMIASTRDPVHEILYKKARPFVDEILTKEVIQQMLLFY